MKARERLARRVVLTRGRKPRKNVSREPHRPVSSGGTPWWVTLGRGLRWTVGILLGCVLVAGISLGILWGYRWVTGHELFQLRQLTVQGTQRFTPEEVAAMGGLQLGQSVLDLNIAEVRARIAANPWIREASVTRVLPDTVVIEIGERRPVFLVPREGTFFYADAEGRPIAPVTPERFVSLPVLEKDEAVDVSAGLKQVLAAMERNQLPFGTHQVAWIRQESAEQYSLMIEKPRVLIQLDGRDVASMVESLGRLWQDLTQRGEMDKVASVFVMPGRAWVSLKKDASRSGKE